MRGCECFADGVGFGVEQRGSAEFVAEDLLRVLGEAVGESLEGLVDGRFEGVFFVGFAACVLCVEIHCCFR